MCPVPMNFLLRVIRTTKIGYFAIGKDSGAEGGIEDCPQLERKKRGAKPKYKFATEAEAVAMR